MLQLGSFDLTFPIHFLSLSDKIKPQWIISEITILSDSHLIIYVLNSLYKNILYSINVLGLNIASQDRLVLFIHFNAAK